jgi:cell division inhibitor SepF
MGMLDGLTNMFKMHDDDDFDDDYEDYDDDFGDDYDDEKERIFLEGIPRKIQ